jgi:hypothetical protein
MEVTGMKAGITVAAIALAVVAIAGGSAGASAGAAKSGCPQSDIKSVSGADYVYKLSASNLSCSKAASLATKFNECRHDNGGPKGHCSSVSGYKCSQKKLDSSPSLYQAKARCENGSKSFKEVFGEFT